MFFFIKEEEEQKKKTCFFAFFFLLVGFFHLNSVARKVETPFYLYQHKKNNLLYYCRLIQNVG
jgi:hypothetical protein